MSNAMRMGKRTLAGVAAGALGLALIPFVATTGAQAAANATGTAGPIRGGAVGSIPFGQLVVPNTQAPPTTLTVITAPSGATMWVDNNVGDTPVQGDDSAALLSPGSFTAKVGQFNSVLDDSTYGIAVSAAGSYTASLGNGTDTTTFSFTTTGAPASMTLTPASQTVLVGATAGLTIELKDAAGNLTQPSVVDTVALSDNSDDTVSSTEATTTLLTSLGASDLATGKDTFYLRTLGNPAGTTTVTATPQGTLPSLGLTAQSAAVTKSGTVATNSVANLTVSAPANAINAGTAVSAKTAQVPSPTTSVTVTIDDTTVATAGNQLRFKITTGTGGFVNAVGTADQPVYINVTTDSNKQATLNLALGGTAAIAGGEVTITQVDVSNADTSVPSKAELVISTVTPAVQVGDVVPTPSGIITAVVGTSTPVSVQVDDSFGTAQAGWVVNAVRGTACTDTVVGTGVTDGSGSASLSVAPASTTIAGQNETYSFCAINPLTAAATKATLTLQVNYETSADVTSIQVAPGAGSAGSFSTASPTQTAYPAIFVPSSGVIGTSESQAIYTVSSGVLTATNGAAMISFDVTTTPANAVTVTAPEGVKVSSTAPTATTLWSAGSQTATITGNGSTPVYVWATKTGVHELTFESTGLSLKGKIFVANKASDAYNIALSPSEQAVGSGAIGTATLTVTDIFGNGVATGTADDSGPVTVTASGEILLAGFLPSNTFTTNASGEATVTFIAGNAAGTGTLAATPKTGSTLAQWGTSFTPPAGAPAPVTSAAATVTVASGPVAQDIMIQGARGIVRDRPGIIVDGLTEGFDEGAILKPWVKFPGETQYAEGVRQILVDQDGEFTWQRRTGKKIYIIIKSEDGTVRSNRIIIPVS